MTYLVPLLRPGARGFRFSGLPLLGDPALLRDLDGLVIQHQAMARGHQEGLEKFKQVLPDQGREAQGGALKGNDERRTKAVNKIWPLMGYDLKQRIDEDALHNGTA